MLSMDWIRDNPELVRAAAERKGIEADVPALLASDERRRALLRRVEALRQARNERSRLVGTRLREGRTAEAEAAKREVERVRDELGELEKALADAERDWRERLLRVPNVASPDTPIGASDEDNAEVERRGDVPEFPFAPRDHVAIGELHGMIDLARGVKTAGSRWYYLRGAGALLHRAVQQGALDVLLERGFTPMDVPLMARAEAFTNTGFYPGGEAQTYRLDGDGLTLIGTSEVPLVNYYAGEIVDARRPIKLAAASYCFRSEAGSAGRDVRGLYRVHQFAKVEQVVLCEADPALAEALLQEITDNAKRILELLELPYRVVAVCTGDMSPKTYKQYDLETWMPSRGTYGETHSSSLLLDFQARRADIRYRDGRGNLRYCYTLNNTAIASPRILIPLLENHQREDGSVTIPKALRPYMYGLERLTPDTSAPIAPRVPTGAPRVSPDES